MLIVGARPQWMRVLLIPSQPFEQIFSLLPDGDTNPLNDAVISDPVTIRFDAGVIQTSSTVGSVTRMVNESIEVSYAATPLPDGTVKFSLTAEQVNQTILDCGSLSRRVRLTIGNYTWATGYFEIDGEW